MSFFAGHVASRRSFCVVDVVESYLLLGLRLGRHVDGLVDYPWGQRLCEAWVVGNVARFARLLTEQVTAAELRAAEGSPL